MAHAGKMVGQIFAVAFQFTISTDCICTRYASVHGWKPNVRACRCTLWSLCSSILYCIIILHFGSAPRRPRESPHLLSTAHKSHNCTASPTLFTHPPFPPRCAHLRLNRAKLLTPLHPQHAAQTTRYHARHSHMEGARQAQTSFKPSKLGRISQGQNLTKHFARCSSGQPLAHPRRKSPQQHLTVHALCICSRWSTAIV